MIKDNINKLLLTRVTVIGEEKGWWDTKFIRKFKGFNKNLLNYKINKIE